MERLDFYLIKNNYFESRNKAQNEIKNNNVFVNGKMIDKPSFLVKDNDVVTIKEITTLKYVSRGGLKLERALDEFKIDVKDKVVLDIGASSGGFSHVCLLRGAKLIYALDVGENQLHPLLKDNSKIINIEKTNFRTIDINEYINKKIDLAVCDVSFISLSQIFENVSLILSEEKIFIALIKPQFEAEHKFHSKNGLVKDKKIHLEVLKRVQREANKHSLYLKRIIISPIRGEKAGNVEYLALFTSRVNIIGEKELLNLINEINLTSF